MLKVDETPQLWPEENTRAGIPDDQIRQVAKSAEDITLPVQGPARGLGGDYPGGDACFGPRPATSTPHGLTTENSAQIPLVGKTSHWGGVVLGVHSYLRLSDYSSQIIYFCLRIFLFLFDFIDYFFSPLLLDLCVTYPLLISLLRRVDYFFRTHSWPAEFSRAFT